MLVLICKVIVYMCLKAMLNLIAPINYSDYLIGMRVSKRGHPNTTETNKQNHSEQIEQIEQIKYHCNERAPLKRL